MTGMATCRLTLTRSVVDRILRYSANCETHGGSVVSAIGGDFLVWLEMHVIKARENLPEAGL